MPGFFPPPAVQEVQAAAQALAHESRVVELVGAVVLLLVVAAGVSAAAKRLRIPFSVALVLVGALLGWISGEVTGLGPLTDLEVTPDVVFFVFLPTLIFQSAFHLDSRSLRENLAPTMTLAVPGLLMSTALIATVMRLGAGTVGVALSWPEALLLGSILSATDPVAVIALFGQLGAPKRLTVLVEGESLFNDATAIVLSRIILAVMAVGAFSSGVLVQGGVQFLAVFFGGLLVGAVLSYAVGLVIGLVEGDAYIEITATTVLAYLSFYLAEHVLGLSGVMAVVAAGVVIGGWGRTKISPSVEQYLEHFWDYLAWVANALIFLLVGLTIDLGELAGALPALALVVFAMSASRAVVVYGLAPVTGMLPRSVPIDRRYQTVMFWGGLRGGIALAIALSLPDALGTKEIFVTLTTGAVLATLVLQGLTIERLVRFFKLDVPSLADRVARLEGLISAKTRTLEEIPKLPAGGVFAPRVVGELENRTEGEVAELRKELDRLRAVELDREEERRLIYLRCFGEEKTFYYSMYSRGHLTEGTYRRLAHSVDLQIESIRHGGTQPDFTVFRPGEQHLVSVLRSVFSRVPGLSGLAERLRASWASRDYEASWARFHGDQKIVADLGALRTSVGVSPEIVDEIASVYASWQGKAKARLDQIGDSFPEFVSEVQDHLAERLAFNAEREAIEEAVLAGTIPRGVADDMLTELDREIHGRHPTRTPLLGAGPEELLAKVPFFRAFPEDEFAEVAKRLQRRTAPIGDVIVRQGERGASLFLIARGVVRVVLTSDATEQRIATLLAGDFFGEMALLHGGPRTATCRAVSPCVLYELRREELDRLTDGFPSIRSALEEADRRRRDELEQTRGVTP